LLFTIEEFEKHNFLNKLVAGEFTKRIKAIIIIFNVQRAESWLRRLHVRQEDF